MKNEAIINLKENQGKQIVDSLGSNDSVTFLMSEHKFENYTVQIVKAQWTKTQKAYCVRVLNFNTGNRPHLQIPCDSLKLCKLAIDNAAETGVFMTWTGHKANVGKLISSEKTLAA